MPVWSWQWHPHPDVLLLVAVLAGGYWLAIRRLGPRRAPPGGPPVTRGQVTAFSLGVGAIWLASYWPVHDLAEGYLYSVHMLQHLLLSLVAPPLLLLGTPGWLFRTLLGGGPLLRVVRTLARPLPALLLFNGVLALTHWAALVDLAVRSEPAHFLIHVGVFGSATLMWMPVLSPVLEIRRLSEPGQMLYLFLQSIVPTVPASFLTFASTPIYAAYAAPGPFGIDALTDLRIAGLTMKIIGGLILWIAIAVVFFKWAGREERSGLDALRWQDVDRELSRADLIRPEAQR